MRARTCLKCKEFVVLHPSNPKSKENVNKFEKKHRGHNLVTLQLDEIDREKYTKFGKSKEKGES
ncbi:MAG: hypothetical protein ACOC44_00120 [Promethearchaeia archaeon]